MLIVNWNGLRFLENCLESLRRQTYQDFETILIDNGSTDASVGYVQSRYPEVKVVALIQNLGFQAANIAGLEHASAETLVLLNNDTEAMPEFLEALAKAVEKYPEAGSFACKMMNFQDRTRIDNCGAGLTAAGVGVNYGSGEVDSDEFRRGRWVFSPCGGAAAYRRAMLDEVGFFDSDFFMTYDDLDLAFRSQLAGYPCRFVPEAVVYHHYRGTMAQFPQRQVYFSQRSIEWVYLKNMPLALALRY
ncbi:MAG: glycosyltransferase family 2 protein, partial [Terriglobales bacterium]